MATRGRPPSLTTSANRIKSLAQGLTNLDEHDRETMLGMAGLLKSNLFKHKDLGSFVTTLDRIHTETSLTNGDSAAFVKVIDGLARQQANLQATPVAKLKPKAVAKKAVAATNGKPEWMKDNEKAQKNVRDNSIEAIVGAIVVILGEVSAGYAENDDFDTLGHLVRTLQRIY